MVVSSNGKMLLVCCGGWENSTGNGLLFELCSNSCEGDFKEGGGCSGAMLVPSFKLRKTFN